VFLYGLANGADTLAPRAKALQQTLLLFDHI
jgi:hypothetical protein